MQERGSAVFSVVDVYGDESTYTLKRTTYQAAMSEAAKLMTDKQVADVDVDFRPSTHPVAQERKAS